MRSVFDSLDNAAVAAWPIHHQEEHLHLDFKSVQREDFSHVDDKKNLARALSGFANSDGGLLVWGVDARPNEQGIDCAVGFKGIRDHSRVLARLNSLTGEYVSPLVEGVVHKALPLSTGQSCIVTFVPASDSGPHMAKAGENRYYKRSGSAFYVMEHFDLEDMFGRRRRPRLVLFHRFEPAGGSSSGSIASHETHLVLRLSNTGRGVAKSPFVGLKVSPPYSVARNLATTLPRLEPSLPGVNQYGASTQFVIHPGISIDLAAIGYSLVNERGRQMPPQPMTILYEVAAEDMRLETGELVLHPDELLHGRFPDGIVPSHV